ncbi:MAG: glycosyltransferase, partial [Kiritimatiellae bacterium]|nr:glycosyltransferase [Kiritimatiellia bacterium]
MAKPLVVIPTYNEKDNAEAIAKAVLENLEIGELLFVDDNSPDGTGAICDALAAANPRVHVMHRESKEGLGRAYLAGFRWALDHGFDRIFEMDADLSHDPHELPNFIKAAEDADLVLG